jgi:hypothetical protein
VKGNFYVATFDVDGVLDREEMVLLFNVLRDSEPYKVYVITGCIGDPDFEAKQAQVEKLTSHRLGQDELLIVGGPTLEAVAYGKAVLYRQVGADIVFDDRLEVARAALGAGIKAMCLVLGVR